MSESKYNILFCDDEQIILDSYKEMIEKTKLKNLFDDVKFAKTYHTGLDKYDSVKDIVEEYKEYNELINIAVVDVNFEKSKELNDEIDSEGYSYHNLGILIARFLKENMKGIEIIFVTANPAETKSTKSLMAENIHYIEKQTGANLELILEDKIFELIENRIPKKKLSFDSYLYEIDYLGEREYVITNNSIRNNSESLKINFKLTQKVDDLLKTLIYLSCIKDQHLSKKPQSKYSQDIKNLFLKFGEETKIEDFIPLYEDENLELLKMIFKKVTSFDDSACKFDYKKAKSLLFGENNSCKNTCKDFLVYNKSCPMLFNYNFNYNNKKEKELDIGKSIKRLKDDIKNQILENKNEIKNISTFRSILCEELVWNCNCSATNLDSIKNCSNPFCSNSLIFSNKAETGSSGTKYSFLAKPSDNLVKVVLEKIRTL